MANRSFCPQSQDVGRWANSHINEMYTSCCKHLYIVHAWWMCAIKLLGNVNNNFCTKRDSLQTLNIDLTVYHTLTIQCWAVGRGERSTGHCACHHHGTLGRATAGHWHRGSRGLRNHPHQLQRREATHSPQKFFPCWRSRPHLCSLQLIVTKTCLYCSYRHFMFHLPQYICAAQ